LVQSVKFSVAIAFAQEVQHIGSQYNRSARPFLGAQPASAPHPVHMQYNSPVNLYSADNAQSAAVQRFVFFPLCPARRPCWWCRVLFLLASVCLCLCKITEELLIGNWC